MNIEDVNRELIRRNAIVVHCSRPGRDGEFLDPKPLYPLDLEATIRDLQAGSGRGVSCSVIWPEHQETFGAVGIIIEPGALSDIKLMHASDAGYSDQNGGLGAVPSLERLADTFDNSSGHNEWVLTGGRVLGVFISFTQPLAVARKTPLPAGLTEDERALFGEPVDAQPISISQIASDFPSLPIFAFLRGELVELTLGHPMTVA
jgi:hypothetical protein